MFVERQLKFFDSIFTSKIVILITQPELDTTQRILLIHTLFKLDAVNICKRSQLPAQKISN